MNKWQSGPGWVVRRLHQKALPAWAGNIPHGETLWLPNSSFTGDSCEQVAGLLGRAKSPPEGSIIVDSEPEPEDEEEMTVTTAQIRDLLNRPRGLNEATITEYISIRTRKSIKKPVAPEYLASDSANAVTTAQKRSAIKTLVCMDCLLVLVNTNKATFYPSMNKRQSTSVFKNN